MRRCRAWFIVGWDVGDEVEVEVEVEDAATDEEVEEACRPLFRTWLTRSKLDVLRLVEHARFRHCAYMETCLACT